MLDEIIESSKKRPYVVVLIAVLISAGMLYGALQVDTSTDIEDFIPNNYTSVKVTDRVENQTGGMNYELVLVKGDNITSAESFRNIVEIDNELEKSPRLDNYTLRVKSYTTVLLPIDNYGSLTDKELEQKIDEKLKKPSVKEQVMGSLLSNNKNYAIIRVFVNSDMEYSYLLEKTGTLHTIIDNLNQEYKNLTLSNAGSLSMERKTEGMMGRDNAILIPSAIIVVIIILYLAFNRISDTILPFIVLSMGSLWMIGTMGLLGIRFSVIYVALIPVILGAGIDYTIHVLNRFYEERGKGLPVDKSAIKSIRTVGIAVSLSAITTIIGFASFGVSDLPPIQNFGILAGTGVFYIFVLSTTMLPSILVIRGGNDNEERQKGESGGRGIEKVGKILKKIVSFSDRFMKPILSGVAIITVICIISSFGITTSMSYDEFLPNDSEPVKTMNTIKEQFGVQESDSFVLVRGDIRSPQNLKLIDNLGNSIKNDKRSDNLIGTPKSIVDAVKAAPPKGKIPDSRKTIDFWITTLENAKPKLMNIVLPRENTALVYIPIRADESRETEKGIKIVRDHVEAYADKTGKTLNLTLDDDPAVGGEPAVIGDILKSILPNMRNSIILAIILVIIVLGLVFKSPWFGLIGSLPVTLALFWELGLIRAMGWSLDVMNMMVSALAIGMGVDFTIHITQRFREEWKNDRNSPEKAMLKAIQNVGLGILAAAATTIGVFAVLSLSRSPPITKFGQLSGIVILFALIGTLIVLPIVLLAFAKWKQTDNKSKVQ